MAFGSDYIFYRVKIYLLFIGIILKQSWALN